MARGRRRLRPFTGAHDRSKRSGGLAPAPLSHDGLAILYDSLSVTSGPLSPADAAVLQASVEQFAGLVPSYVVSSSGEFLRIHDVAAIKARLDSLFAPMLAGVDSTGQARATLELENVLVLVTEPATLLPHSAEISRTVRAVGREADRAAEFSQVDVRTYAFSYRR